MKHILFIDGCISLHEPSRTKILCERYLAECLQKDDIVERVDLKELNIQPMTGERLAMRQALLDAGNLEAEMFSFARQFQKADRVVIGAPYWDLSMPAAVKAYMEQIMVCGITFRYTETGAAGLCKADKLVYIMTAEGFADGQNFGFEYAEGIAHMLGVKECRLIYAQGLDVEGADTEKILEDVEMC